MRIPIANIIKNLKFLIVYNLQTILQACHTKAKMLLSFSNYSLAAFSILPAAGIQISASLYAMQSYLVLDNLWL